MEKKYSEIKPITRDQALEMLKSGNQERIAEALVSISFLETDWKWVQDILLEFLKNENPEISGLAATCLGHVARIHKTLDKERVIQELKSRLSITDIAGQIHDALDDIKMFVN